MADAFIHIQASPDGPRVSGIFTATFGRRIEKPGARPGEGVFAGWAWDGRRLHAYNCRYGFYPVYYFERPGEICVSTSIARLLAEGANGEFDDGAMAAFLHLGFFLGEDTPFASIRALPPNAALTWTAAGLALTGGPVAQRLLAIGRDEAIDRYIAALRQAVRRRLPEETVRLPLSGGRDSRHLLFELHAAGVRPACLTVMPFPTENDDDVGVASQLAAALSLEHAVLPQSAERVRAELRKNVLTSFCSDEHAQMLPLVDRLATRPATVFDGIGGDVLSAGLFLDENQARWFGEGQLGKVASAMLSRWNPWADGILSQVLETGYAARFCHEAAHRRLVRELASYQGSANPLTAFYFWNRTRREIALYSFGMTPDGCTTVAPYLDHDVFDLLFAMPADTYLDGTFHTDAIHRAFPAHRHVPFSQGAPVRVPSDYFRQLAWDTACYLRCAATSEVVSTSFVLPRLSRAAVEGRRTGIEWLNPLRLVHLAQLENLARGGPAWEDVPFAPFDVGPTGSIALEEAPRSPLEQSIPAADPKQPSWYRDIEHGTQEIAHLASGFGQPFVLVDSNLWTLDLPLECEGIPFSEHGEPYECPPSDDQTAIAQLERLRREGVVFIAFARPSFWWLDHYVNFHRYLRATYRCIHESDLVVAFDLKGEVSSGSLLEGGA